MRLVNHQNVGVSWLLFFFGEGMILLLKTYMAMGYNALLGPTKKDVINTIYDQFCGHLWDP